MKLLWLDVETNSLDPLTGRLLEVAATATDLEHPFEMTGTVVQGVLPVAPEEASIFDAFIKEMHTKNGLLIDCLHRDVALWTAEKSRLKSPERREAKRFPARYYEATAALEEWLLALIPPKVEGDRDSLSCLAGSSVHFDLAFLRVHMPRLAASLSHRVYDVSSVKLFCRSLGMPKLPPEEAHRAWPDVMESIRHAEACAAWLAKSYRGYVLAHKPASIPCTQGGYEVIGDNGQRGVISANPEKP